MAEGQVVEAGAAPAPVSTEVENPRPSIDPGQSTPAPTTKADPAQGGAPNGDPASAGAPTGQPAFDVQKSYDELRKQFTKVTQDYSKDRRTWNQTLTELQTLKKSQTQFAELLSKATETPVDPARFWTDLQSQGPAALDGYLGKKLDGATQQLKSAYIEQANRALDLETKLEKISRRMDSVNYPDFAKLEPIMEEIADPSNEDCPIDWNQPIGVIYDALYKLARSRSSEDAVKAAEEFGRKQADEAARKEAATAVPGGGKGGAPTTDLSKMSEKQLRQFFIDKGMVESA